MEKQKKIVFLGGMFQAEFSMRASLEANGVKCYYVYEAAPPYYLRNLMCSNYNQCGIITYVSDLKEFLKEVKPDAIIHRFYMDNPVMHHNAYEIAQSLNNIPYGRYLMETDTLDNGSMANRFRNCDFVLYAHDTDKLKEYLATSSFAKKSYFYCYGVGVNEHSDYSNRTSNLVAFGYPRFGIPKTADREVILQMIIDGLKKTGLKLNVFHCEENKWGATKFVNDVVINDFFYLEQENEVFNKFKVVLNFESVHRLNGAYSHKMFQAMGRGLPTLTYRKKCLEKMFGFSGENLIFFESAEEITYWIFLLMNNDKFRIELGNRCEAYVHEHYDWYKRFNNIMIQQGIWDE